MSLDPKWKPMRWRWKDPALLTLLDGTGVNCLVVDWAAGSEADAAQQAGLKALIDAGRRKGIGFVGRVTAKEGLAAIAAAGKAAGLEALLAPGPVTESLALPAIALFSRDDVDWDQLTETFAVNGNVWPGAVVHRFRMQNAANPEPPSTPPAEPAGPTSDPWVASNGWLSLLARSMAPGKTLWLEFEPKEAAKMLPAEQYCLAVADARASGCRWIIDLDEAMRTALAAQAPQAVSAWRQIAAMDAFFDRHAQWTEAPSPGVLAVVSDFSAANAAMSNEVLNLLQRQHMPFDAIDRRRPLAARIASARAVLWVDDAAPTPEQHALLMQFVTGGGLVIAPQYWGPKGIASHQEDWLFGYDVYPVGKGRVVVARDGFSDPYQLDRDTHNLVGHEHDPFRLFNPGTASCFLGREAAARKEIVQVLNYDAPQPVEYLTLWVRRSASAATLWSAGESSALKCIVQDGGTSFDLPPVSVYYAVEIERQA